MQPSVGRIVLFGDLDSNGQKEHPAIINRVWSGETVNLTVFPDCGAPVCKTSVPLLPEGTQAGYYWRWPDRVPS
jgi:hypothetical protein